MYCPRCGHQPISDELRFCSYCGFKLGVVKASLSEGEDVPLPASSDVRTLLRQPRQRDINIGAILMFAGATLATFLAARAGPDIGREGGAVILAIFYSLVILLSSPITKGVFKLLSWEATPADLSAARKGMGFGATLMFISTIVLAVSSLFMYGRMRTTPFFVGLLVAFALLLVISRHLMRALQILVTEEATVSLSSSHAEPHEIGGPGMAFGVQALPAAQDTAIPVLGSQRVTTAEIVSPPSVTENTTSLLDNK
jgi:zinc-ribbon domain